MKIVNYQILSREDEADLSRIVQTYIDKGWQPFGGLTGMPDSQWLYQAIVKYEAEP